MAETAAELLVRIGADVSGLRTGTAAAQQSVQKLQQETNRASRSLSQSGNEANQSFQRVARASRDATSNVQGLTNVARDLRAALGLGSAIAAVTTLGRLADTATLLASRIRLVTESEEEFVQVSQRVFSIAQETRTGLEATTTLYTRLARATESLGTSQADVARVTETINKSLIVSGASAAEAENGLIQLSQALASGALRGDELRSVLEQMPSIASAIAAEFQVTVGQLRELGAAGELTSERVVSALLKASDDVDQQFGKIPTTIGQAFTKLSNETLRFVGSLNEATGASRGLATALGFVADNIEAIATALLVLVGARSLQGILRLAGIVGTIGTTAQVAAAGVNTLATALALRSGTTNAATTGIRAMIQPIAAIGTSSTVTQGRLASIKPGPFTAATVAAAGFAAAVKKIGEETRATIEAQQKLEENLNKGIEQNSASAEERARALEMQQRRSRGRVNQESQEAILGGTPEAQPTGFVGPLELDEEGLIQRVQAAIEKVRARIATTPAGELDFQARLEIGQAEERIALLRDRIKETLDPVLRLELEVEAEKLQADLRRALEDPTDVAIAKAQQLAAVFASIGSDPIPIGVEIDLEAIRVQREALIRAIEDPSSPPEVVVEAIAKLDRLDKAIKEIPNPVAQREIGLEVDTTPVRGEISAWRRDEEAKGIQIPIGADVTEARRTVLDLFDELGAQAEKLLLFGGSKLNNAINEVTGTGRSIRVGVDVGAIREQVNSVLGIEKPRSQELSEFAAQLKETARTNQGSPQNPFFNFLAQQNAQIEAMASDVARAATQAMAEESLALREANPSRAGSAGRFVLTEGFARSDTSVFTDATFRGGAGSGGGVDVDLDETNTLLREGILVARETADASAETARQIGSPNYTMRTQERLDQQQRDQTGSRLIGAFRRSY